MAPINVSPISPLIGAEGATGDVRVLDEEGRAALRDAVFAHQVVFLRGQHLNESELVEVASWFAEPRPTEPSATMGETNPVSTFAISIDRPPRADLWHTDMTFLPDPPAFGLLSNVVAPPAGGNTVWSSSYLAFDVLSAPIQRLCAQLVAEHGIDDGIRRFFLSRIGPDRFAELVEKFPPVEHPVVIRHPVTGRAALFLACGFLNRILDLHPDEATTILAMISAGYDNPNHQVSWRWSAGDLAIWDQRATNHRGLSNHWPVQSVFAYDGIPATQLAIESLEPAAEHDVPAGATTSGRPGPASRRRAGRSR
jgi:taurine dioxygenase